MVFPPSSPNFGFIKETIIDILLEDEGGFLLEHSIFTTIREVGMVNSLEFTRYVQG